MCKNHPFQKYELITQPYITGKIVMKLNLKIQRWFKVINNQLIEYPVSDGKKTGNIYIFTDGITTIAGIFEP